MHALSRLFAVAALAVLSVPVRADLVLTRKTHNAAYTMPDGEVPARDSTTVVWVGKDRLRVDDGERIIVVRLDTQKLHVLDPLTKTAATTDLPVDLAALTPPDMAKLLADMGKSMKITSDTTTETRKIQGWDATKSVVRVGANATITVWTTNDLPLERANYDQLVGHAMSIRPGGAQVSTEMRKLGGVSVLTEREQTSNGVTMRSRDEIVSAETKDAPAGTYEVPADYTAKPFDAMEEITRSMPRRPLPATVPPTPGVTPR